MKVETYEIEEIKASEASTMACDSEAVELIQRLGLKGQESLTSKDTETRFPYPRMSASEAVVYAAVFPSKTEVSEYRQGIIPLRVLQVIAFCRELPQSKHLMIWHATEVKEDPILVGAPSTYSSEYYLLARWGDALPTFEELKKKAAKLIAPQWLVEITRTKKKLDGYIDSLNELIAVYVETGKKPSWSVYD